MGAIDKKQTISVSVSVEHVDRKSDIQDAFSGFKVNFNGDFYRASAAEMPMQIFIFLTTAFAGGAAWDLLKIGISKIYSKYKDAHVSLRGPQGIEFVVMPGMAVRASVILERKKEFESIKNIDDVIAYLNTLSTSHWNEHKLNDIAQKKGLVRGPFGGTLKKAYFTESGYKVYEQKNAIYKSVKIGNYYIDEKKYVELARFAVVPGDFIISCSGTIGKIFEIPESAPNGVINQALLKIRLDQSKVINRFFYYYFIQDRFQNAILDNTQGGAMKNLVGMAIFRNIKLKIPSLSEQKRIVAVIETWDKAIEVLEKKIALKKQLKKGLMQKLLTGELRLPGFSGGWKNYEIGQILDYEQPTKYLVSHTNYSDDYNLPVLTAGKTFLLGYTDEKDGIYEKGPVIIFDDFTTANKYVDFRFKVKSSAMKMLTVKEGFNLRYIFERMQLLNLPQGEHKRRYLSEYQYLACKIPAKNEQDQIVKIIRCADDEITFLEKKLKNWQAQRKYLINNLVTGKIRTPENLTIT